MTSHNPDSDVTHPEDVKHPPPPLHDRIAAKLGDAASSVGFLAANLLIWVIWVSTRGFGIDHFPFSLLTLVLSFEAIVLTIAVLVGQRLDAAMRDREAEADLKNDAIAAEHAEKMTEQLDRIERFLLG